MILPPTGKVIRLSIIIIIYFVLDIIMYFENNLHEELVNIV